MQAKRPLIILFIALFISSCALKKPQMSEPISFTLNSNLAKLSDMGFIYEDKSLLRLEAYKLGQPLLSLKITDRICLNQACFDELVFNERFFKDTHYKGFLSDILRFKPLYSARDLSPSECGFRQSLSAPNYEITYTVCGKSMEFRDFKNQILMKITKES